MGIKKGMKYVLFSFMVLVLAACGSTGDTEEQGAEQAEDNGNSGEQVIEREELELTYEITDIDVESGTLLVSLETNLPNETEIYRAVLEDEEGRSALVEYEYTIEDENEIAFALSGMDEGALMDKEYQLTFHFNVTEKTNNYLFTDESFGGSFAELEEVYQDSEQVSLTDLGLEDAYTITLSSSNTNLITEENFVE